jgi:hypothetical protein
VQDELNGRIGAALTIATRANVLDSPEYWWQWWNEVNEVYVPEDKPVSVIRREQEIFIEDQPPPPPVVRGQRGNQEKPAAQNKEPSPQGATEPAPQVRFGRLEDTVGGRHILDARLMSAEDRIAAAPYLDCLTAGTLVWTLTGPVPVEKLLAGDMVLSQNAESGELTYKPVLRTTIRPRGKTVRVTVESETIAVSGGHLFWVAGEGWVKARHLKPGQELHGRDGPRRVSRIVPGEEVETYNLEAADFHKYFVGEGKVLCHDNTVRRPTSAIVPGLAL